MVLRVVRVLDRWPERKASKFGVTVAVRVRPLTSKDYDAGARNATVSMHGSRWVRHRRTRAHGWQEGGQGQRGERV